MVTSLSGSSPSRASPTRVAMSEVEPGELTPTFLPLSSWSDLTSGVVMKTYGYIGTRLPISRRSAPCAFAASVSDPPPWKIWISFASNAAMPVELAVKRRSASTKFLAQISLVAGCGGAPVPAASAPASAAPTPSAPPVKITITYGSVAADVLPTYVALEQGIFLRNGLDAELQLISSSTAAVAALVSGNADFSQAGGSEAISATVGGADIVVVVVTGATYSYLLMAAADIKTPNDLKRKKVGISTVGSSSDVAVRVALKKIGIDPDKDVSIVPVGGVPERVAAMKSGAIQATDDAAMGSAYDFYTNEVIPAQPFPRPELFGDAITALAARNDKVKGFDASKLVDQSFVQKAIDRGLDKG